MSSWTYRGEQVPFVPYYSDWTFRRPTEDEIYRKSLETYGQEVERATIPVERINGTVLMITGGDDRLWPSEILARIAEIRLEEHRHPHYYKHLVFPDAGHGIGVPYLPTTQSTGTFLEPWGGTPGANARAAADSWAAILELLDQF